MICNYRLLFATTNYLVFTAKVASVNNKLNMFKLILYYAFYHLFTISFNTFVFMCTWRTKRVQNTGFELSASPSARPTSISTESFSIKFCTEVYAEIDRGNSILFRNDPTQAPLTPTN